LAGDVTLDRSTLLVQVAREGPERDAALAGITALPAEERAALIDAELARAMVGLLADRSRSRQRAAADALAAIAGTCLALDEALRAALDSSDQRLRWGAAYAIGRSALRSPAIWPAVREAMALDDGDQRWAAAELACTLAREAPETLAELRGTLSAEQPTLRKMALYCMRDLGGADLGSAALAALADHDAGVRLAALSALARCQPGEAKQRAECADRVASVSLADPEPGVRRAAVAALGKLGVRSPSVLEALAAAERDRDASLARAAAAARRDLAASSPSGS
jgi:HEAT repeat protein